jgi:hypothetical protein
MRVLINFQALFAFASREAFLKALTHGSAVSWQHVNLLGEYDFSEERLQDTVGINAPKLAG